MTGFCHTPKSPVDEEKCPKCGDWMLTHPPTRERACNNPECLHRYTPLSYVVGFAFYGSSVLLIEKIKPAWQKNLRNGVGGLINPGETPIGAMTREFVEEASLQTGYGEWRHRVTLRAFSGGKLGNSECYVNFFSMYLDSEQRNKVKTTTKEELVWVPVNNLAGRRLVPNLFWLIPLCFDESIDPERVIIISNKRHDVGYTETRDYNIDIRERKRGLSHG